METSQSLTLFLDRAHLQLGQWKTPGEQHLPFIVLSSGDSQLPVVDNKNKEDFYPLGKVLKDS